MLGKPDTGQKNPSSTCYTLSTVYSAAYKKENYLKVRTVVFKYITPYSKDSVHQYVDILVYYTFLRSHVLIPCAGETRPFLVDQSDRLDFISLSGN